MGSARATPRFEMEGVAGRALCLWDGAVADPIKTSPFPMCYHVKFGSSASKGYTHKETAKLGSAEVPPLRVGVNVADPLKTSPFPSFHVLLRQIW